MALDTSGAFEAVPPNPGAGQAELAWLDGNMKTLGHVAGLWVAIKGETVRASSDNLEELLDWLVAERLADALVTRIPDDVGTDQYVIA
jgi:hypothetical protein